MGCIRQLMTGLVLGSVVLVPMGCGSDDSADEPTTSASSIPSDDPGESAEQFLHALADDDPESACRLMADEDSGPAEPDSSDWSTCVSEVTSAIADPGLGSFGIAPANLPDEGISAYAEAKVGDANVDDDGQRAEIEREMITGVDDNRLELSLVTFDDRWYVTDVDEETG